MSSTINQYENFLHIFLMVGASKANMLTDQLDKKIITVSLLNAM